MMNFFTAQEQAQKRTAWLVFVFAMAIVAISLAVYAAVSTGFVLYRWFEGPPDRVVHWWSTMRFGITLASTFLVVVTGSLMKQRDLSRGGQVVLRQLGGHRVDSATRDPLHRQLYNVVEEMSIASGVPVPDVFVFEGEFGINALAAGFTIDDAAIGVTQGALQALTRDELQGVIAHEFSHILNGDMRMNTKLMGWLHGILMLTILGELLRHPFGDGSYTTGGMRPRMGRVSGGGGRGGGGLLVAIVVVAVLVTVIGYMGAFVARRIKYAIMRQREYLADAAAVQFTRNPAGIGGALMKVGGLRNGSHVMAPRAEEASHMFFSNPMWSMRPRASGSHPPVRERIHRIDPYWDGTFPKVERPRPQFAAAGSAARLRPGGGDVVDALIQGVAAAALVSGSDATADVLTRDGLAASGRNAVQRVPDELRDAAHHADTAREILLAMLLHSDTTVRQAQLAELAGSCLDFNTGRIESFWGQVSDIGNEIRLALVDMLLPAIKRSMSAAEFSEMTGILDRLIRWDHNTTAFEFLLRRKFRQAVGMAADEAVVDQGNIEFERVTQVAKSAGLLLSLAAQTATPDREQARTKFHDAIQKSYVLNSQVEFVDVDPIDFEDADAALDQMRRSSFALRRHLVEAVARCAALGEAPTPDELSLLRMFSQSLGCPLPQ